MAESTFKTMYLVSKSDLDNNAKNNFKLSLQNKDICDGGMNVSVKPIKTRLQNKTQINKTSNLYLDNNRENEDDDNQALSGKREQEYRYSRPTVQSAGTNTTINQQYEKDDENEENTVRNHQLNTDYGFRSRKRKHEEDENDDQKENGGIISSDEEDEMLRYQLKRLQGSKTNNFGEKLSNNQEGKSIAYDAEPSLQKNM